MKLNDDFMEQISFGKVSMDINREGYTFQRFTKGQKDIFATRNLYDTPNHEGYFLRNCETDANISLDFETDSKWVTFDIAGFDAVNGSLNNAMEIFVNAKKVLTITQPGEFTVTLSRAGRVKVWFPYFAHITLRSVSVADGSYVKPHVHGVKWLCMGDSITHGCSCTMPSRSYVSRIVEKYNVDVINQGNSGYVNDGQIVAQIPGWQPDVVTSAYGINDFFTKPFAEQQQGLLGQCKALREVFPKSKIYLLSPIWAAYLYEKEHIGEQRKLYRMFADTAEQMSLPLIDGRKLVPHNEKYYQDLRVHPNDAGFSYYASRLGKLLFGEDR